MRIGKYIKKISLEFSQMQCYFQLYGRSLHTLALAFIRKHVSFSLRFFVLNKMCVHLFLWSQFFDKSFSSVAVAAAAAAAVIIIIVHQRTYIV